MTQLHAVIPLKAQQIKQASELMGRAFLNDPLWQYLVPDEARRARVVPLSMGILVRYSFLYGEVYTTPALEGVVCWLPPGKTAPTFGRLVRIGIRSAPLELGWTGFRRYTTAEDYTEKVHKRSVPERHWYLWGLGVEPALQGHGIGGMLIQHVMARAAAEGLPCYLETMNERNVPFYQKQGFKVVSEGEVPKSELFVWGMLREPG
jgi:ribosomal protein S18 acetylase RimI-like enzyme